MKARGLQVDSERDSGFSDASSEHLSLVDTTDSEDSPRAAVQQGVKAASSGPSSQLAVVGGSYSGLSPMIIMNNVLLKQPGDNPPALKPWGFRPTVEVVQPVVQQPQVVFLQPLVSRQPSPASKELSSRHRRPKNYLPILKSYPKIAPHPGDGSGSCSSGRGTASWSEKSASQAGQRDRQQKSGSFGCSAPAAPSSPSSVPHGRPEAPVRENPSSAVGPADLSSLACFSAPENTQALPDPSESSADIKRKRFCNTYNILSKSGLLDIALRTKELHRQNRRTQSELEQLKEQTDLFLQALYSGDPGLCVRLHARL
uniref:CLOCK interacting pacemaker n=1 Tax=Tetraodon nigroviridis TaxID=99883 RepID=H3CZH8_TETNG